MKNKVLIKGKIFIKIIFFFLFQNYTTSEEIKNIYIFIHGTWHYNFLSLLSEIFNIEKPTNVKNLIKRRWIQSKNKAAEKKGLILVNNINSEKDYLKREIPLLEYKNENLNKNSLYYKYNWNGILSNSERHQAAKSLASELIKLQKQYPNAKFTLIGYSHGGNVLLLTAKYISKKNRIPIDTVVLLATPVNEETEFLANSKTSNEDYFFKNIYFLYSEKDTTQIKDITHQFPLCNRYLKKRREGVTNIQIQYQYKNNNFHKKEIINYDPNHKDFWAINQSVTIEDHNYRYEPVFFFIQNIIEYAAKYNKKNKNIKKLTMLYKIKMEIEK